MCKERPMNVFPHENEYFEFNTNEKGKEVVEQEREISVRKTLITAKGFKLCKSIDT